MRDQLNINNQNIKTYFENYMAARAVIAQARSLYWPTITLDPGVEPVEELRQPSPIVCGQHRLNFDAVVSSGLCFMDAGFFGKIRNEVRSAQYAAQISAADLEVEKLTEQASLAELLL